MRRPDTRYAKSDGGYVAWQSFGDAKRDILFVSSWATNIDAMWDEPSCALFFERLSKVGRVICFDKRGTGLSDPVPLTALPTLEGWMHDALLSLDAAGSPSAVVIGDTEGGPMAMLLAATFPDRVSARAGLHTGEIERRPAEIGGIAVHLASRVLSLARQGEILVSGTVADLVIGADITFEDRGIQTLKGIPGNWRILRVANTV